MTDGSQDEAKQLQWILAQKRLLPQGLLLCFALALALWCTAIGRGYRQAEAEKPAIQAMVEQATQIPTNQEKQLIKEWANLENELRYYIESDIAASLGAGSYWRHQPLYEVAGGINELVAHNEPHWNRVKALAKKLETVADIELRFGHDKFFSGKVTPARHLLHCALQKSWCAARVNDWQTINDMTQFMLSISDHTCNKPVFIDALIGIAVEAITCSNLLTCLTIANEPPPDSTILAIRDLAATRLTMKRDITRAFSSDILLTAWHQNDRARRHSGKQFLYPIAKTNTKWLTNLPLPLDHYPATYTVDRKRADQRWTISKRILQDYERNRTTGDSSTFFNLDDQLDGWDVRLGHMNDFYPSLEYMIYRNLIHLHAKWKILPIAILIHTSNLKPGSQQLTQSISEHLGPSAMIDPAGNGVEQLKIALIEKGIVIISRGADGEWDEHDEDYHKEFKGTPHTDPYLTVLSKPFLTEDEIYEGW